MPLITRCLGHLIAFVAVAPCVFAADPAIAIPCPTSAEIPEKIMAARFVLENPPSKVEERRLKAEDREFVSQDALIRGLVDFVVARGKAEVQVWFVRSVVDTLCTRDNVKNFFSSTCQVYQSVLFKDAGSLSQADLASLANNIKTDVTYAPACALYGKVSTALKSVTMTLPAGADQKQYKEGIAALGYFYTAVALEKTEPVDGSDGLFAVVLAGVDDSIAYDGNSLNIPGHHTLAAWRGVNAAMQGDYSTAITQIAVFLTERENEPFKSERVSSALRTAVALATAKDADAVASILDDVASPVGAWAVKQSHDDSDSKSNKYKGAFVTSLTALPGVQVADDSVKTSSGDVSTNSYGLFLPVGVQFTKALNRGAIGLMLAPIDAGAVISYADKKEEDGKTVESNSSITWESIVAPGVYLTYSFYKSPFVLGIGYQRSPHLRSVSFDNTETKEIAATDRTVLFFSVDVTMFMHAE